MKSSKKGIKFYIGERPGLKKERERTILGHRTQSEKTALEQGGSSKKWYSNEKLKGSRVQESEQKRADMVKPNPASVG